MQLDDKKSGWEVFENQFNALLQSKDACFQLVQFWDANHRTGALEIKMQIFMQVSECLRLKTCEVAIWDWIEQVVTNADETSREAMKIAFLEHILEPPVTYEWLPFIWKIGRLAGNSWVLDTVYREHPELIVKHEPIFGCTPSP